MPQHALFSPSWPSLVAMAMAITCLTACGDKDGTDGTTGDGGTTSDGGATHSFATPCNPVTFDASVCDPDLVSFTLDSTNPWYPLTPGLQVILEGEEDGELERVERTVLEETRTIAGVEVHVLEHLDYIDGEIYEVTYNFYVESTEGTVCYFGEDVEFYEDGALKDTHGTWRVGEDGAKPGVIMPADPQVGDVYYQEVAPGIAEDMGRIDATGETMTVGVDEWTDVLVVMDSNPIDDEDVCVEERKLYVQGVGEIADVHLEVISWTPAD